MPERISQYQWVNLYADDGWVRLLRALHQERQKSRKWNWRLLVSLTSLLLVAGFIVLKAVFQPFEPNLELYEKVCKSSDEPLQIGFARLESCSSDQLNELAGMWETDSVQLTPLNQSITGYDIVIWGSCNEEITLQFELVSSRKPDEIYEPTNLQVTGTLTELGNVGKALISYQRGEYVEAANQFETSELAAASPALALLKSNSLMFSGNYEEAISVLEDTVIVLAPEWGAAYNNLGVARFNFELLRDKSGYIYSGLPEFEQAIKYADAQDDAEVLSLANTNKGDLLRRAGNWEDAEGACWAARVSSPQSSSPYICLALFKLSRYAGSSEDIPFTDIQDDLDNAKRLNLPPAKLYYLQGGLYRMQNQEQEALADYKRFLEVMYDRACLEVDWRYIKEAAGYITELQR